MSICVKSALLTSGTPNPLNLDGVSTDVYAFVIDPDQTQPCVNYQLLTGSEQSLVSSLNTLFAQYLDFDPTVFEIIIGASLVAYALGHSTGAILKLLNRT